MFLFFSAIVLVCVALSSAVTNNIIVHKNEVSAEMEAHIVSYALALVANQTDINTIETHLVNEMNSKYGQRWLVYTTANQIEIANSYITPQPNSLYWFSFHGQNFYLIKPLPVNQIAKNATQQKNFTELVINARNSEIKVLLNYVVQSSDIEKLDAQIRYALNVTENCVSDETPTPYGNSCYAQLAKNISSRLGFWVVVVAEKQTAAAYREYSFARYSVLVGDFWIYFDYRS